MNIIKLLYIIGSIFILLPVIIDAITASYLGSILGQSVLTTYINLLLGSWYMFLIGFINLLFGYFGKSQPKIIKIGKIIVIISVALLVLLFISILLGSMASMVPS